MAPGSQASPASKGLRAPLFSPSTAQSVGTAAAGVLHPKLEIVEQGTEDRDALSTTLRTDPTDLRLPTGFQRVYRVPGSDTLLMRGNGALFAVFEQSVYRGQSPASGLPVPPGTIFHIGMPSQPSVPQRQAARVSAMEAGAVSATISAARIAQPIDARVSARVETHPGSGRVDTTSAGGDRVGASTLTSDPTVIAVDSAVRSGVRPGFGANVIGIGSPARSETEPDAADLSSSPVGLTQQDSASRGFAHLRLGPARVVHEERASASGANP